jgi:sigma-B regulation protein RsbU (phosphoserine phosphatase)
VLGLLEDARFEEGEARLESGDLLAMVTDGVTEALSEDEQEFGDDRVAAALGRQQGRAAEEALQGLLAEVSAWTGAAGCADDLTAVLVAAR